MRVRALILPLHCILGWFIDWLYCIDVLIYAAVGPIAASLFNKLTYLLITVIFIKKRLSVPRSSITQHHHHHHFICPIIQQCVYLHEYDFRRAGQQGPIRTLTAALKRSIKTVTGYIFYHILGSYRPTVFQNCQLHHSWPTLWKINRFYWYDALCM